MKNIILISVAIAAIETLSGCKGSPPSGSSPLVVANAVMKDQGTLLASPDNGGMVADLYIEPRNLMLAPDTATVGCDQRGNGTLGIANYLSHPEWITQHVLFTDLNVPSRNFLAGFPIGGSSVTTVDSYFTMDIKGTFHLDDFDLDGYYQFAVIADDAAEIRTTAEGTTYDNLLVDDSKPAGANNGCLEQTQSAHLSCSSVWANQAGANIKTIHIVHGQNFPLEVKYWEGPGQGISFVVLYRKVADPTNTASLQDASCGQELDFSANGAGMVNLLTRWKTVSSANLLN
jgi:hypothetical protein